MKKRLFNSLIVGLMICSTYVFAFANTLNSASDDNCKGNGHWEKWDNHPNQYMCYDGGTECNAGSTQGGQL